MEAKRIADYITRKSFARMLTVLYLYR